jgi:hypothetical protein
LEKYSVPAAAGGEQIVKKSCLDPRQFPCHPAPPKIGS